MPTAELLDPKITEVSQVILSWDRIGPWLPWMKMGNKPGQLIYSAQGLKIDSFSELPEWLQAEINNRLPLYKEAPERDFRKREYNFLEIFQATFFQII